MNHQNLKQFLIENKSDKKCGVSHVSMIHPKIKMALNKRKIENFWELYCNQRLQDDNMMFGIGENLRGETQVTVDIDIKVRESDIDFEFDVNIYNQDQLMTIVNIYRNVLQEMVEDCDSKNITCVVLEKPLYYQHSTNESIIKNGFHLQFPYIFLEKDMIESHIYPRVKKLVKESDCFRNLGIEDSSSTVDKATFKNPWLLYGCRKSEDMDPYTITHIILDDGQVTTDIENVFRNYKIFDDNEEQLDITGRVIEYLPRILSVVPYGRETQELKKKVFMNNGPSFIRQNRERKENTDAEIAAELKLCRKLLPLLDDYRAEEYNSWMEIGWILYNIGNGCDDALDLWLEFSQRSDKYNEDGCCSLWDKMESRNYSIGTLKYFAKLDSPEEYKNFTKEHAKTHIREALDNGSHNDIAKAMFEFWGTEFVCASVSNKVWYQFKNHIWEEIEEGIYLRQKISDEIFSLLIKDYDELNSNDKLDQDKAQAMQNDFKKKQLRKLACNLKSSTFKNNVMKEAMEVFYDPRFKKGLDQNAYLVAFNNGVYDLSLNEFRPGKPEDFISKSLPIDYKEFSETDEEVQNVVDFLQKIFPDNSVRKYFLDTYSEIFIGGNLQKKIYLWTGEGDNGKSITQSFFEKMLGELSIKFNTQYFTGKKVSTGSANPELARAAPPVRYATMEEPDADEQLNIGELKKLSGGDSYWARDLFEKGKQTREVFPMFMLTFICNKLPKIKYSDKATWNRLRVIPFESTFVEPGQPCPETLEEQIKEKRFPMDKDFKNKIPGMICAFAWYLLEWNKNVICIHEPEKVLEATKTYRKQNDTYRQFIEENIIESENSSIKLRDIYAGFKDWFKEGFPNMQLPIKNDVKEYFVNLWGPYKKGVVWQGYTFIDTNQEDNAMPAL